MKQNVEEVVVVVAEMLEKSWIDNNNKRNKRKADCNKGEKKKTEKSTLHALLGMSGR